MLSKDGIQLPLDQNLTHRFCLLLQLHLLVVDRVCEILDSYNYFVLAIEVNFRFAEANYFVDTIFDLDMELTRFLAHWEASQCFLHS